MSINSLNYEQLKMRQRDIRDCFPPSLSLRVHRALSWLQRAELETEDHDARFMFLWVAFNAAYANEVLNRKRFTERKLFMTFLERLIRSDEKQLLYRLAWDEFPNSIRLLLGNRYVYQPFWDYHNGQISELEWMERFERSKASATRALGRMDTRRVLAEMFDRLYVLRNQLLHGGATWNSQVNREQVAKGANIMGSIVPIVIHLMMESPNRVWGEPCYPVVE